MIGPISADPTKMSYRSLGDSTGLAYCSAHDHGCPVGRNRLFAETREQLQVLLTGLVPVIHAFPAVDTVFFDDVGGRNTSGHGEFWLCR